MAAFEGNKNSLWGKTVTMHFGASVVPNPGRGAIGLIFHDAAAGEAIRVYSQVLPQNSVTSNEVAPHPHHPTKFLLIPSSRPFLPPPIITTTTTLDNCERRRSIRRWQRDFASAASTAAARCRPLGNQSSSSIRCSVNAK